MSASLAPAVDRLLAGLNSPASQRTYRTRINLFFRIHSDLNAGAVLQYKAALTAAGRAPATINCALVALIRLAKVAARLKLLPPEEAEEIAQIDRAKRRGVRQGNWLSPAQAGAVIKSARDQGGLVGLRDAAIAAVALGCALRRSEIAGLEVEQFRQLSGQWTLADVHGKGNRLRTVETPGWAVKIIERWLSAAGLDDGPLFRRISKHGTVTRYPVGGESIARAIRLAGRRAGIRIAAHDARRTWAKNARRGGAKLEQIQIRLGHSSIQTTMRYIGDEQDFSDPPCDHLGIDDSSL